MRNHNASGAGVFSISLTVFSLLFSSAHAANVLDLSLKDFGLLINFSVPCDLHSDIAIPDEGGLLTPNLLAVGYSRYMYDGSTWQYAGLHAALYNKTLVKVGRVYGGKNTKVTFEFKAGQHELGTSLKAKVHAQPVKSVYQMFSIPLQLLNVTGSSESSNYQSADYVQRYGTQNGLPPIRTSKPERPNSSIRVSQPSTLSTFRGRHLLNLPLAFPDAVTSASTACSGAEALASKKSVHPSGGSPVRQKSSFFTGSVLHSDTLEPGNEEFSFRSENMSRGV